LKEAIAAAIGKDQKELDIDYCIRLSEIPLFLKIIELCPIPDLEIEYLLTEFRRILLLEKSNLSGNSDLLSFQSSLALQCFTNEFVYEETAEETAAVEVLESILEKSFSSKEDLSSYDIACLASYRPLYNYSWIQGLVHSPSLDTLFKRQVLEVNKEYDLQKDIPRLNPITDNISLAVQNQYEENPYPRWINTRLEVQSSTTRELAVKLDLRLTNKLNQFPESPQILIAGCGTGQHSLATASRFKNSHVTAIDLSLSSLGYAKRKTEELGFTNIKYMQADILDLGMLNKQFDIVESVGVLHHMADPVAGWRVLMDCLKPGGLMRIGLYSELARQNIVKARNIIAEKEISPNKEDMLEFRRQIIKLNDPEFKALQRVTDFYSTSMVRDLLFHAQEHRFTISQISKLLNELGLVFIGFEFAENQIKNRFKVAFPQPEALYDLDKWNEFENLKPRLFIGMYQFWVQKV
jgi:2-polyprenyl-3-methyl-5-hydroxy-6-metoxy-1,4-benzoquinol methylase